MQAKVGDQVVMHGRAVGMADHGGEIVEVRGNDGAPPYVVRFDDGHEGLVFPGPDCLIRPC
ncbi:DUF1918 domain-containing protein [Nocardia aurantia]|uniref:DUF1918 domain-containing protein n=1 Tax=Nocardia aurantia TaxID=2585199 RepID=A0A7K0E1W5_9NOCA|nr:DUF1918 domain-containing protein [Nocardia aurantia]MQY31798.1 hypothetical protein [Nocardia aurantia]